MKLELIETLVEYDGPQVAIFVDNEDTRLLGVCIDECRWLIAEVTTEMLRKLYQQELTLRDALIKDRRGKSLCYDCAVDEDWHIWSLFALQDLNLLPGEDSYLPTATCAAMLANTPKAPADLGLVDKIVEKGEEGMHREEDSEDRD